MAATKDSKRITPLFLLSPFFLAFFLSFLLVLLLFFFFSLKFLVMQIPMCQKVDARSLCGYVSLKHATASSGAVMFMWTGALGSVGQRNTHFDLPLLLLFPFHIVGVSKTSTHVLVD